MCRGPGFQDVLLAFSCRGREGATNWCQLALQMGAPVGNLHSHTFNEGVPVCQHQRFIRFIRYQYMEMLLPACSRSPCPALCTPGRLDEKDFRTHHAIKTLLYDTTPTAFCLLLGPGENLNPALTQWLMNALTLHDIRFLHFSSTRMSC